MREILPGVLHWSVLHPKIKVEVSAWIGGAKQALQEHLSTPGRH